MAGPVELVERSLEAWNADDLDATLALAHPDVEIDFRPNAIFPGLEEVYRGHDGMRRWWHDFKEPFDFVRVRAVDTAVHGDLVVATLHFEARGKSSGASVELELVDLYEFRDGLIVRFAGFRTVEEALGSAGIESG